VADEIAGGSHSRARGDEPRTVALRDQHGAVDILDVACIFSDDVIAAQRRRGETSVNAKDRVTNNLVALSSAAVLTVYAAGFIRTRPAALRFAQQAERRPAPATRISAEAPASSPTSIDRHETLATAAPPSEATPNRTANDAKPTVPATAPATAPAIASSSSARRSGDSSATVGSTAAAPPTTPAAPVPAPVVASVATPPAPVPTPVAPARDSSPTATAPVAADSAQSAQEKKSPKDGIFFGWGTSRHGDIQAGIEIKNGRIVSAFISECLTQYSCSWISALPAQVIARQSPEVDYVSGATQSSNAFYYAVADALKKAK
jgi:uncharacterized protein with FMN-binding domain